MQRTLLRITPMTWFAVIVMVTVHGQEKAVGSQDAKTDNDLAVGQVEAGNYAVAIEEFKRAIQSSPKIRSNI